MAEFKVGAQIANQNAGAQQQLVALGEAGNLGDAKRMSTFLPVESKPNIPPNMRMHYRWDYLLEYIGYWKAKILDQVAAAVLIVLGVLCLPVFAPGALLMIAVGARFNDLAWMNDFIINKFGKSRTIVLVD
jgi:hypothetical protein